MLLLICFKGAFSQDYSDVNLDKGVSHDNSLITDKNISIPLYTVKAGGISIPIYLSYNTRGMLVSDVPTSVGFGWELNAGGEIKKQINHLVDETKNGWLFSSDSYGNDSFDNYQTGVFTGSNKWTGKNYFENVDATPDVFRMMISNGDYLSYYYEKSRSTSIFQQSGNFNRNSITTNLQLLSHPDYEEDEYYYENGGMHDIVATNKKGVNYAFRKGIKRAIPFDAGREGSRGFTDSLEYKNYYLNKVFNHMGAVEFEYSDTKLYKLLKHAKATRGKYNITQETHPEEMSFQTRGYYEDVSIEDVSRKEIKKIVSNNSVIEFKYKKRNYSNNFSSVGYFSQGHPLNRLQSQEFKLLDEISIYDSKRNYISGYKFIYTHDQYSQDQVQNSEGGLKIKFILKYGKNHKDNYVYRKFNYYDGIENYSHPSPITPEKDVFGYLNGASENNQYINDGETNLIPISIFNSAHSNRMPNESFLVQGMLKSVMNESGGKTEYNYKENRFEDNYYGGLLIDAIKKYDSDNLLLAKTIYEYDQPEGFGLPMYDDGQYGQGNGLTPPDIYDGGLFDEEIMYHAWQTYFSKKVPNNYILRYNVRDTPYELPENSPEKYNLIANLQLSHYTQQTSGSFYRKVTQTNINVNNGQSEKGVVIKYHRPSLSGFSISSVPERTEYYDALNIKRKEEIFNYEDKNLGFTPAYKFDNIHLQGSSESLRYVIEEFPIYKIDNVLKSTQINEYDEIGNLQASSRTDLTYLNEGSLSNQDFTKLKTTVKYFNNEPFQKIENKYLQEYQPIPQGLYSLVNLNPLTEKNVWYRDNSDWKLKSSTVKSFNGNGNIKNKRTIIGNTSPIFNSSNFVSSFYDVTTGELISHDSNDRIDYIYDSNKRLLAKKDLNTSISTVYQRDNNGLYIDAILTTNTPFDGSNNFFVSKSFEYSEEPNVVKFMKSFSGSYVFNGGSINLGDYPSGYKVSYWSYFNGKWHYNSYVHTGGAVVINKLPTEIYLDEIRVQPPFSSMETFTYKPLIGVTSKLNDRGEGDRIEYDLHGRKLYYLDKDYNIIKEKRYNNLQINLTY